MPSHLAAVFAVFASAASAGSKSGVYPTQNGQIQGRLASSNLAQPVEEFLGIPFAAPPVGDNRFRAPQPATKWTGVRDASKAGSICPQIRIVGPLGLGNEDCLYLNVYKPANATAESKLPVMFWIYGGGYFIGDGVEFGLYDGKALASTHNVVIVTHNYRLNDLGFMALDELKAEDPDQSTGNYALQDQQAALNWTQANIRSFGGDPERVTIFGESAGGFSVMWHLVSPRSRGLFSAAIMESGTSSISLFFQPFERSKKFYEERAAILGCGDASTRLSCLRKLPANKFVIPLSEWESDKIGRELPAPLPLPRDIPNDASPIFPVMPYGPTIDSSLAGLMGVPAEIVAQGEAADVPLILGANKDGGNLVLEPLVSFVIPGTKAKADNDTVRRATAWFFPNQTTQEEVLARYPLSDFQNAKHGNPQTLRIAYMLRDVIFGCSDRRLARLWSGARNQSTFLYTFSADLGPLDKLVDGLDFHASELPFVWKTWLPELSLLGVPNAKALSDAVSCRWARFATCHDPNGCAAGPVAGCASVAAKNDPRWPRFDENGAKGEFYSLKVNPNTVPLRADNVFPDNEFPSDALCDFWDKTPIGWHPIKKRK